VTALIKHPATPVWFVLVAATLIAWWFGDNAAREPGQSVLWTSITLIAIAFFKVRLVIRHFMEVKNGPWQLRLICELWLLGVCGALCGMKWLARY